jgi:hypothetical protein
VRAGATTRTQPRLNITHLQRAHIREPHQLDQEWHCWPGFQPASGSLPARYQDDLVSLYRQMVYILTRTTDVAKTLSQLLVEPFLREAGAPEETHGLVPNRLPKLALESVPKSGWNCCCWRAAPPSRVIAAQALGSTSTEECLRHPWQECHEKELTTTMMKEQGSVRDLRGRVSGAR